jgi:hypothetical protein
MNEHPTHEPPTPTNGHGEPHGAPTNVAVIHTQNQIAPRPAAQPVSRNNLMPVISVREMIERRSYIAELVKELLVQGVDYGNIPGGTKPVLLKPGAEKMISVFGLLPHIDSQTTEADWTGEKHGGEPFFYYEYQFSLSRDSKVLGVGIGSANSWESKYRYRWVNESEIPQHLATRKSSLPMRDSSEWVFKFALDKAETTGPYGKPPEYWQRFHDAIADGSAVFEDKTTKAGKTLKAVVIPAASYRIPNPDVADVVNTLQKMAQKRAYIQATLMATGLSEFFTQDMEDLIVDTAPVADPVVAPVDPAPNTKTTPAPTSDAGRNAAPPPQPQQQQQKPGPVAAPPPAPKPPADAYGEIPQTAPPAAPASNQNNPAPVGNIPNHCPQGNPAITLDSYRATLLQAARHFNYDEKMVLAAMNQYLRAYMGLADRGAMPKDRTRYLEPMAALAITIAADRSIVKRLMENPQTLGQELRTQVDQVANGSPEEESPATPAPDASATPSATASGVASPAASRPDIEEVYQHICQAKGFSEEGMDTLLQQHGMSERDDEDLGAYLLLLSYTMMARLAASSKWSAKRVLEEVEKDLGQPIPFPPDPNMRSAIEVSITHLTTQPNSPLLK